MSKLYDLMIRFYPNDSIFNYYSEEKNVLCRWRPLNKFNDRKWFQSLGNLYRPLLLLLLLIHFENTKDDRLSYLYVDRIFGTFRIIQHF